jgi:hypothetical protein
VEKVPSPEKAEKGGEEVVENDNSNVPVFS